MISLTRAGKQDVKKVDNAFVLRGFILIPAVARGGPGLHLVTCRRAPGYGYSGGGAWRGHRHDL
jgi:hypothetical protein